jgi:hypothetical protein
MNNYEIKYGELLLTTKVDWPAFRVLSAKLKIKMQMYYFTVCIVWLQNSSLILKKENGPG